MTTIENSGSPKTVSAKTSHATTGWFRRAIMGTAFAAVGVVTLGAATTPAQAYWYGYGYHPYYAYYPHHYGAYGYYPAYHAGWGYGWGGGWGWHRGWHRW